MTNHLEHCHSIDLAGPIDRVFPLFTPIGETLWVEGWDPEFLHPRGGETQEGMVFRTSHGDETTLWACTDWQPSEHRVRYARVTPGSRFGFVEVTCRDTGGESTQASIAYTFTALGETGQSYLSELTEDAFVDMIESWKIGINAWLSKNGAASPA
ncbi:hypothetical protein [Mesorhizobium sp. CA5]|uniref:hypothetical protein n=1 Tax=Mesorhizobium sp. CA5 TaxID=2876638 RepID=UPI001CD13329|nr:hypothetical protein [Mesorhizobium sp. CA5]MBZ9845525.1 hypothetical protein [Mesorhizobium sp. CA5]